MLTYFIDVSKQFYAVPYRINFIEVTLFAHKLYYLDYFPQIFNSCHNISAVSETMPATLLLEFKAVIVLPTITHNYGNYPYGNYVGNAPVGKVFAIKPS